MLTLNKIYCMDCLEGLKLIDDESIDLVVTSPPYNQGLTTQNTNQILYDDDKPQDIYIYMINQLFKQSFRVLKEKGSFFYNYKSNTKNNLVESSFLHLLNVKQDFKIAGEIIWKYAGNFDSNRTRFPIDYEMVYHLTKQSDFKFKDCNSKLSSVWYIPHVISGSKEKKECAEHPCPYPLALVKKIIEHTTDKGDTVLDPFMGSGTTAVACKQLQRNFIGFELSQKYVDIANKRLQQDTLFDYNVLEVAHC